MLWRGFHNDLSANPIEFITHATGDWTLRFLVITLAITPLRKILHLPQLIRFRRMMGLFAFFYVCLHFSTWLGLDHFFDWHDMLGRHWQAAIHHGRVYRVRADDSAGDHLDGRMDSTPGRQALATACTALIYLTAIAGVIHYYWLVKSDVRKPLEYAVIVGILLAWRLWSWFTDRRKPAAVRVRQDEPTTAETM